MSYLSYEESWLPDEVVEQEEAAEAVEYEDEGDE